MSSVIQVSPARHAGKYWQRFQSYRFAAHTQFAPLVAAELTNAVLNMSLCFVYRENQYHLMALLSPVPGENYFVSPEFSWLGGYVPAHFRGYPFSLSVSSGSINPTLCVNENSGLISDSEGELFFNREGELSKAVSEVKLFLEEVEKSRIKTEMAVSALGDAGLISQWPLKVKEGEREIHVEGLYKTNEPGLNQTDDQTFLRLRKAGALPLAYAQLLSMGNVRLFQKLAEFRGAEKPSGKVDLQKLMGEDDIFKF